MYALRTLWLGTALIAAANLLGCSSAKETSTPITSADTTAVTAPTEPTIPAAAVFVPTEENDAVLSRLSQLPTQDRLPAGRWQAGRNYDVLVPAQPTNAAPGKVEVVEVFWYGCSHCYELEPFIDSWKKNKPANIELVRLPVTWNPPARLHARLYYTLLALKREDLHTRVFDSVFRKNNPLIGRDEASTLELQVEWAKENGIDAASYTDAFNSMWVSTKLRQADELVQRYRVEGTPYVIVNGKYTTDVAKAGGQRELIALINDLAAAETRR